MLIKTQKKSCFWSTWGTKRVGDQPVNIWTCGRISYLNYKANIVHGLTDTWVVFHYCSNLHRCEISHCGFDAILSLLMVLSILMCLLAIHIYSFKKYLFICLFSNGVTSVPAHWLRIVYVLYKLTCFIFTVCKCFLLYHRLFLILIFSFLCF